MLWCKASLCPVKVAFAVLGLAVQSPAWGQSSRLAEEAPPGTRAMLIAMDGEFLAEIGDCSTDRQLLEAIHQIVRDLHEPEFATSDDGRALVVTETVLDCGREDPAREPVTYAWADWRQTDRYLRLPRTEARDDYITISFVLVSSSDTPREAWLISLSHPERRYALPDDTLSCDVLGDGRWVGLTGEELLVGTLEGEGVRIDRRMPYEAHSIGPVIRWCPGGEAVFVKASLSPPSLKGELRPHRRVEVVLVGEELQFAAQPKDLTMEKPPVLISVRREGADAETRTRILGEVDGGGWYVFELVGDELRRTDERAGVGRTWGPEVPSPDGRSAIVCRRTWIWNPDDGPPFSIFRLTPDSNIERYTFPFRGIGGWLACDTPDKGE